MAKEHVLLWKKRLHIAMCLCVGMMLYTGQSSGQANSEGVGQTSSQQGLGQTNSQQGELGHVHPNPQEVSHTPKAEHEAVHQSTKSGEHKDPQEVRKEAKAEERAAIDQAGFRVDFGDKDQVTKHFFIDERTLFTYKSVSCVRRDHVRIGVPMEDSKGKAAPQRGTLLVMDNQSPDCSDRAQISTGHLHGRDVFHYGKFSFKIRLAHALTSESQRDDKHGDGHRKEAAVAPNAMSCLALYTNQTEHNEIAACFRSSEPRFISLSFFVGKELDGDKIHLKRETMKHDLSDAFHDFTIYWAKHEVVFSIDGEEIWRPDYGVLPWEPMTLRLILRPFNIPSTYQGKAQMAIGSVEFTPVPEEEERKKTHAK
mmetsp:Transcript_11710/g.18769  ORF Transcript_11710/g.18769 Transcript_11710/m.18769 type:complete len:368 (+) Transcript_11710:106-1209(+)